jgi:hypothetical protein
MALTVLTVDDIVNDALQEVRILQPEASLNVGSVNRDIGVESYAIKLRDLYVGLSLIQDLNYYERTSGEDLDNFGSNYAAVREAADYAIGEVFIVVEELNDSDYLTIPEGTVVSTDDAVPIEFETIADYVFDGSKKEEYRVLAQAYSEELLAVEDLVPNYILRASIIARTKGPLSNVDELKIKNISVSGFKVINLVRTSGGIEDETDSELRAVIEEKVEETAIGTPDQYEAVMTENVFVEDTKQIYSDVLMERDTGLIQNNAVQSDLGNAGDFWIRGKSLYVNREDIAFVSNQEYLLGQPEIYGEHPMQPIWSIGSVVSSTGDYLAEDVNYELVKDIEQSDSTVFANSIYSQDNIKFLSPIVTITEAVVRGTGTDDVDHVSHIINSVVSVTEEREVTERLTNLAAVGNNKLTVQNTPVISVISVYNATLQKYYIVSEFNATTGVITISNGGDITLPYPRITDTVYVTYIYQKTFQEYVDFIKHRNAIIWLEEYGPDDTPGFGYGYQYGYAGLVPVAGGYGYDYQYGYGDISGDTPIPGGEYKVQYTYLLTEGETVSVYGVYNKLISDLMNEINVARNLTADIITKQALSVAIDVSMTVTLKSNYTNQSSTIRTKIEGEIFDVLNNKLIGQTIYISDIVNVTQAIEGVDNVTLSTLKESTETSGLHSVSLSNNEYPVIGTITITFE